LQLIYVCSVVRTDVFPVSLTVLVDDILLFNVIITGFCNSE